MLHQTLTFLLIAVALSATPAIASGDAADQLEKDFSESHVREFKDVVGNVVTEAKSSFNVECKAGKSAEQCAAEFGAKVAKEESRLSLSAAKGLAGFAKDDEALAQEQEKAQKEIANLEKEMQNLAQQRNRTASQPNPNKNNGKNDGGSSGGGSSGGGGGGSPAQNGGLQPAKGSDVGQSPETAQAAPVRDVTMDLGGAGRFDVTPPTFDPNLGSNQTFQPNLSPNANRAAMTSSDTPRNFGGQNGYRPSGKSSGLSPIQDKPAAPTSAEAAKGGGGGSPGISGGGGKGIDVGEVPNAGNQELEPAPPPPKKITVDYAASGGADGASGGNENGDGDKDEAKVAQVAPARVGSLGGGDRGARAPSEKRTGHGIMDYVGYIGDSCHDKSETMLKEICIHDKTQPPIAGTSPVREREPASSNPSLASATNDTARDDAPVPKANLALIRDGLERAFARRLPDDAALKLGSKQATIAR